MKRSFAITVAAVIAAVAFAGLVYAVLVAAHVSEPAAITLYGLTLRRAWATAAAVLAVIGLVIGGLALARPMTSGSLGPLMGLAVGVVAALNGGLSVAVANGGPGTGNGVVGGAAAFVLGLIAVAIGGLAFARKRRIALQPARRVT